MGSRPGYDVLRQDENWSSFADPKKRTDPLDALKFIPLDSSGSVFLTTAIDSYVSYRSFRNELNGTIPSDATLDTRLDVDLSLTIHDRVRLYGSLKHADAFNGNGPASPINRKGLDLHQAFVEVRFGDLLGMAPDDLLVRIGRQEINYGSGGPHLGATRTERPQ